MSFFPKKILSLILLMVAVSSLTAQDYIYFRNGGKAKVRIIERTRTEVVYQLWAKRNGPVFRVSDHLVKKVETRNGQNFDLDPVAPQDNPKKQVRQRKNHIMIDLIGPALGHTSLTYERKLPRDLSLEISVGYIGLGKDFHERLPFQYNIQDRYKNELGEYQTYMEIYGYSRENKGGGYLRFGPRLPLSKATWNQVFYLQPEVLVSYFEVEGHEFHVIDPPEIPALAHPYDFNYHQSSFQSALFLHLGYQVVWERLILDAKFGMGYLHQQFSREITNNLQEPLPQFVFRWNYYNPEFHYTHLVADFISYEVAVSFALRVGIVL